MVKILQNYKKQNYHHEAFSNKWYYKLIILHNNFSGYTVSPNMDISQYLTTPPILDYNRNYTPVFWIISLGTIPRNNVTK